MAVNVHTLEGALQGSDELPAIVLAGGGPTISRKQLREQVVFFANTLRRSGVKPGDVVSIAETNTVRRSAHGGSHVIKRSVAMSPSRTYIGRLLKHRSLTDKQRLSGSDALELTRRPSLW